MADPQQGTDPDWPTNPYEPWDSAEEAFIECYASSGEGMDFKRVFAEQSERAREWLDRIKATARAEGRAAADHERVEWENELINVLDVADDDDVDQRELIMRRARTLTKPSTGGPDGEQFKSPAPVEVLAQRMYELSSDYSAPWEDLDGSAQEIWQGSARSALRASGAVDLSGINRGRLAQIICAARTGDQAEFARPVDFGIAVAVLEALASGAGHDKEGKSHA